MNRKGYQRPKADRRPSLTTGSGTPWRPVERLQETVRRLQGDRSMEIERHQMALHTIDWRLKEVEEALTLLRRQQTAKPSKKHGDRPGWCGDCAGGGWKECARCGGTGARS